MEKERFENWETPIIEHNKLTKWNWLVQHPDKLSLGQSVDIGAFTYINAKEYVEIGDNVQIGSHCSIYSVSTIDNKKGKVIIKKNACVGTHCTIMPNVTIGENTTIGAHSFVNKDLPDNVVAYGIPAKVIKCLDERRVGEEYEVDKILSSSDPISETKKWKMPFFKTYSDKDDIEAIAKVIKRGTNWAVGPEIQEFEYELAKFVGTKYALTFNSGTSALHTLLLACDVKGKEVIVPSFTFIATANAVILAGGIPVFAECESETFGLDAEDVRKKITSKTKAVIPIHYGGCACRDIEKLARLCNDNNLLLLDDAAESLGADVNGKKVGTFGTAAMFSFCQNKIISCGEGGVIVTENPKLYERMKLLRSLGRIEEVEGDYFSSIKDCDYLKVGFNFRMPTMNAALGLSQLRKINFELMFLAKKDTNMHLCDLSSIQNHIGRVTFFQPSIYINTDMVLSLNVLPKVASKTNF